MENKNVSSRFTSKKPGFDHLLILIALATREHKEIPAALKHAWSNNPNVWLSAISSSKTDGKKDGTRKEKCPVTSSIFQPLLFYVRGCCLLGSHRAKKLKDEFLPNKSLHNINPYQPLYPMVRKKEALRWIRARWYTRNTWKYLEMNNEIYITYVSKIYSMQLYIWPIKYKFSNYSDCSGPPSVAERLIIITSPLKWQFLTLPSLLSCHFLSIKFFFTRYGPKTHFGPILGQDTFFVENQANLTQKNQKNLMAGSMITFVTDKRTDRRSW